jgi:hypothetical protein
MNSLRAFEMGRPHRGERAGRESAQRASKGAALDESALYAQITQAPGFFLAIAKSPFVRMLRSMASKPFSRALTLVYRRAAEYLRSVLGTLTGSASRRALGFARIPRGAPSRPLSRNPAPRMF